MGRIAKLNVESTPAQDRIKGFKTAIRKLELEKSKIDLDIQKLQLEIKAVEEEAEE